MENEDFQSSEILLEMARAEYQNEFSRTSVIDTKVGITLPIVVTYFFLVLQFESIREYLQPNLIRGTLPHYYICYYAPVFILRQSYVRESHSFTCSGRSLRILIKK